MASKNYHWRLRSIFEPVDLLTLAWDEVYRKRPEAAVVKIMGGRNKTKARQKIPISPAFKSSMSSRKSGRN
jgi:hypothetical protein